MEGNVTNKEQTSSYAKDFSGTPKQMEHQKAMVHEDHDFQLKMQEAQHNHECTMKDKELGRIGLFFGTAENSSKNISALICFLLLSAIIVMSGIVYYLDKDKDFIGNLWQMILPVITLSLGYIFGKRE
ncbi:hypothetical protein DW079_09975 [Segatella copri]|jgi:hypothetical protein|uniref:Uncharacterized protein n=1 Tax=Segatella copri TaxID=165179 RepID=A0A3R6FW07_9BACT|nr:hypothetical protein DW079_09975 [Segatella copri]